METIFKEKAPLEKIVKGNTIFTIFPYKLNGGWYFDDEHRDLHQEAFVAGADDLLDLVCKGAEKCIAIFSATPFPNYDLTLTLVKEYEDGSGDYYCTELKHDLWLCSANQKYFIGVQKHIYLKIKL